jgi:type IV pilus assembly protein PilQ
MRKSLVRSMTALAALATFLGVASAEASGGASAANSIERIDVEETPDATVITIQGTADPTFTAFKLSDPPRIFVDLANATLREGVGTIDVRNGVVAEVGTIEFESRETPVARIVVLLDEEASYDVESDGKRVRVVVDASSRKSHETVSADYSRVKAAVAEEKDLLQEIKLARLREEQLREKAAASRIAEEGLAQEVAAARAAAEQARLAEQAKVDALRQEREALELALAERSQAETDLAQARAELAALAESAGPASADLAALDAAREREEIRLTEVNARVQALQGEVDAKRAQLSAELRAQEDALARLEADYAARVDEKKVVEAEVGIQQARIRALEAELAEASTQLERVTAEREREEVRVGELRSEATTLAGEIDALRRAKRALDERLALEAQARQAATDTKVAALEARVRQLQAKGATERSAEVVTLQDQIATIRAEGAAKEQAARQEAAGQIAALEVRLSAADERARSSEAREQTLEAQVDALESALRQARAATDTGREQELATQLSALEQELAQARADRAAGLERASAEQAALAERVAGLERELSVARATRDDGQERYLKTELSRLESELRQARLAQAYAVETQSREAELKGEVARLESELADAKAALAAPAPVSPQAVQAAPAPAAHLARVDFRGAGDRDRIELGVEGDAKYRVLEQSDSRAVLLLEGTSMPAALERSLDTADFGGPVSMISTYRSTAPGEEGDLRVVVNLRDPAPNRVQRTADGLVWEFDAATSRGAASAAPAPQRFERPEDPSRVRYYPNMVGQAGAAAPADAPEGSRTPLLNPYGSKKKGKKYTGKRINLTIKDADIQHVLTFLAKEGRVNIVAGDDVRGQVSFHLEDIPWDLALDMILKAKGFDYLTEQGVYRVAPREAIQEEVEAEITKRQKLSELRQQIVRLIPVNYASAEEISGKISGLLSEKGTVSVDERTNTLVVKDYEDRIAVAEDLVRQLDTQTPQVLIEARIVEASSTFTRDVGIQWGGNFAMSPVFGNETGLAFPSIVGVSGGASGQNSSTDGLFTSNPGFAVNLPAPAGPGAGGALGLTLGNLSGSANLNLRLSAQEEEGNIKIISSPRISTLDNRKAIIRQGVSIPISVVSSQGVNTQFFNADLSLEVTPHVTQDGHIALRLVISKNEPDFGRTAANGNPTIQKKEAQTELLLRDGDTTVIGGIFTRNYGENYSKVPVLGDIPILGWLFKAHGERDERSELLIFITPRIVNRPMLTEN